MKRSLTKCPVCGDRLKITEYRCSTCGTVIRGSFEVCEFCALGEEQLDFLRLFLKSRGNLSVVAKALGISHPTARQKLNNLLYSLGYEPEEEEEKRIKRQEILDLLESGEISPDEALKLLKGGK